MGLTNWVEEVLRRYNLHQEYSCQRVLVLWDTVVGEQTARVSRADRFANGTLWVSTSSSTVAHELSFFASRYVDRLNSLLGTQTVRNLRFVPGHFDRPTPIKRPPVSVDDREEAQRQFSAVADPTLRRLFERLYLTSRQREAALLAAGGRRCPRCGVVFVGEEGSCPGCRFDEIETEKRTD